MRRFTVLLVLLLVHGCGSEPPPVAEAASPAADALEEPTPPSGVMVDTLVASFDAGTGGISVAPDGTIYSSDFGDFLSGSGSGGTRIFAITPEGETRVFAEGLQGASGSAIDSNGTFFQSNIRANTISRIAPDGTVEEFVSEGLASPVGIEVDAEDNLYVANCGDGSIQRISPEGESTRLAEDELLSCPNGITLAQDGNFYVANFYNGDVVRVTPDGGVSRLVTLPGENNGHLIHHEGSLYVVGRGAHRIYRVELDGRFEVFAGSGRRGADDGPAESATFSFPNDIGISPDGSAFYINEPVPLDEPHTTLSPTRLRRIRLPDA